MAHIAIFYDTTVHIHMSIQVCIKYANSNFCEIKGNKTHNYLYFGWKIAITDFDVKTLIPLMHNTGIL